MPIEGNCEVNEKMIYKERRIRERWWSYCFTLFNGEKCDLSIRLERGAQVGHRDERVHSRINEEEVKDALRKMKSRKAVGPNLISIETWKCLGEERI